MSAGDGGWTLAPQGAPFKAHRDRVMSLGKRFPLSAGESRHVCVCVRAHLCVCVCVQMCLSVHTLYSLIHLLIQGIFTEYLLCTWNRVISLRFSGLNGQQETDKTKYGPLITNKVNFMMTQG